MNTELPPTITIKTDGLDPYFERVERAHERLNAASWESQIELGLDELEAARAALGHAVMHRVLQAAERGRSS